MKRKRFSVEQIVAVLKQADLGVKPGRRRLAVRVQVAAAVTRDRDVGR